MDTERDSALKAHWEKKTLPHRGIEPASAARQSVALPTELHPHSCRFFFFFSLARHLSFVWNLGRLTWVIWLRLLHTLPGFWLFLPPQFIQLHFLKSSSNIRWCMLTVKEPFICNQMTYISAWYDRSWLDIKYPLFISPCLLVDPSPFTVHYFRKSVFHTCTYRSYLMLSMCHLHSSKGRLVSPEEYVKNLLPSLWLIQNQNSNVSNRVLFH